MVSSMALTVSFGPDSALLHSAVASSSGAGVGAGCDTAAAVCCSGRGCSSWIAPPPPFAVSLATLPQLQRLGRRDRKGSVGGGGLDAGSDLCSSRHINSSKSLGTSRRKQCAAAELKTLSTVEVGNEDIESKSVFRPPLGWPIFAGTAPDLHLLGKGAVTLPDPAVIVEEQEEEEAGVSNGLDGSEDSPSTNLYRHWIATEFGAAVQAESPPPRQKQENSERDNYYVNVGYAIRTLGEDLPNMFYKKFNFDIYRDDITFRDPMNVFSGIDNYKLIFWALRFHGRIFFKALWVDIQRVWQPCDKVIMVRWTVRGVPRVPWEAQGHFEGTSEYKLDKDGKIYEHKVDNVIFNSPPAQKNKLLNVLDLVGVEGAPTPSFYCKATTLLAIVFPYLQQFTWVRFYWALRSTLALNNAGDCFSELGLNA